MSAVHMRWSTTIACIERPLVQYHSCCASSAASAAAGSRTAAWQTFSERPSLSVELPARFRSFSCEASRFRGRHCGSTARPAAQRPRLWPRLTLCSRRSRAARTAFTAAGIRLCVNGRSPAASTATTGYGAASRQAERPRQQAGGRCRVENAMSSVGQTKT